MKIVDTRGLVCPAPLIKTRQGLTEAGADEPVQVIIDNPTSLSNVKRYLTDNKLLFLVSEEGGVNTVTVTGRAKDETEIKAEAEVKDKDKDKDKDKAEAKAENKYELKGNPEDWCSISETAHQGKRNTVIAITSDMMGSGDDELGTKLMISFFRTLVLLEPPPASVVFYNSGVKMALDDSPVLDQIAELKDKGTGIYLCTTCINHFGIKERLPVGSFSDMYQILNLLKDADHIIRP
jgi:selenium metabolism protein YedF